MVRKAKIAIYPKAVRVHVQSYALTIHTSTSPAPSLSRLSCHTHTHRQGVKCGHWRFLCEDIISICLRVYGEGNNICLDFFWAQQQITHLLDRTSLENPEHQRTLSNWRTRTISAVFFPYPMKTHIKVKNAILCCLNKAYISSKR